MYILLLITTANHKSNNYWDQVGSRLVADLLFVILCLGLAGCSLVPPDYSLQKSGRPTKAMINNVPFFAQDELQCGPAALAMSLNWSGVSIDPSDLSPEVYTPGLKGSLQNSLIGSARRHGRVAYPIAGIDSLFAEISAGHPVIVLVNLGFFWYPKWHYAVAIGYDQEREQVTLHSGTSAEEVVSFWTFNNLWKRSDYWGLLVLSPDRLPAVAEENRWLIAVAGLEKTGHWGGAATGYNSALNHWGNSFVALMGLGNSKYNLGDLDSAADAFYQATRIQPENGLAYNNWANVLAEQGKTHEALTAAQRAVDLGGPFQETFRQTLHEIESSE